MTKKRLSKYELLRIIAMYLIVLHHSIYHGVFYELTLSDRAQNNVNYSVASLLEFGGKVGVFIFVLITGYFMINSKISVKKIIKLWLPIFFWSVSSCLISNMILGHFDLREFIMSFFPIYFNQYWFMTVYVFMYCLIPFLNVVVNYINHNNKMLFLFIVVGVFIIFPGFPKKITYGVYINSQLADFCIVYCIGALVRKSEYLKKYKKMYVWPLISFLTCCVYFILTLVLSFLAQRYNNPAFIYYSEKLKNAGAFLPLIESFSLFAWLGTSDIKYNKVINKIAGLTFGIYLISDSNAFRELIWIRLFHMNNYFGSPIYLMIVGTIVISAIVFVVCAILEWLRKMIFKKLENKTSSKVEHLIIQRLHTIINN